jgi:riboflavin kinase/FMN adenylyltransferase
VETHILEQELGMVMGVIRLEFVAFMRANQKFESLEGLKRQIQTDIAQAKEILC